MSPFTCTNFGPSPINSSEPNSNIRDDRMQRRLAINCFHICPAAFALLGCEVDMVEVKMFEMTSNFFLLPDSWTSHVFLHIAIMFHNQ